MGNLFNWNWLAIVVKVVLGLAAILISAILSYTFFLGIEPAGMAIFPFAALTLTEGGVLGWMLIFAGMKHHRIKSLIALLMVVFSVITTLVVTFAELIQLFNDHSLVSNATVKNGTLVLLEIMLGAHIVAAISDFLIGKIESIMSSGAPSPLPQPRIREVAPKEEPAPRSLAQTSEPARQWRGVKSIWSGFVNGSEQAQQLPSVTVTPEQTAEQTFTQEAVQALIAEVVKRAQSSPKATAPLDTASQPGQANGHKSE